MIARIIEAFAATANAEWAAWSKLLRENFTIVLLVSMYSGIFFSLLHAYHDATDKDSLGFIKEAMTGVAGCLFGMLQGNRIAGSRGSGEPGATTTTMTTVHAEGGPNPPVPVPLMPVVATPIVTPEPAEAAPIVDATVDPPKPADK